MRRVRLRLKRISFGGWWRRDKSMIPK
uniref:Uncharacterized protein n=1 Tax=Medicago truncatula TaxID=3880 RepID=I3SGT2_MEDTR|nr:unknown [Medicago truncatula]